MNRQWQLAQWAELRWWKRYLKNREPHAYLDWKMAYWHSFLAASGLELSAGARVLDAGCGPAGIFTTLPACRVDALDPLIPGYANLPHFRPENYPWTRFLPQTLESFSGEEQYDMAFCLNALNHMRDIPRCVEILYRALKPGGHLLVSVDVHKWQVMKWLFRMAPFDVLHPFQEGPSGYERLFTEAGFVVKSERRHQKGLLFDYRVWNLQKQTYTS